MKVTVIAQLALKRVLQFYNRLTNSSFGIFLQGLLEPDAKLFSLAVKSCARWKLGA